MLRTAPLVALHGLMKFAQRKGYRSDNPTKGARYYREKARERYLTADETARLARALAEGEGRERARSSSLPSS